MTTPTKHPNAPSPRHVENPAHFPKMPGPDTVVTPPAQAPARVHCKLCGQYECACAAPPAEEKQ